MIHSSPETPDCMTLAEGVPPLPCIRNLEHPTLALAPSSILLPALRRLPFEAKSKRATDSPTTLLPATPLMASCPAGRVLAPPSSRSHRFEECQEIQALITVGGLTSISSLTPSHLHVKRSRSCRWPTFLFCSKQYHHGASMELPTVS